MGQALTMGRRNAGVSLLELIMGIVIISIFLGMTTISLRKSIEQEGPKALTYALASDIKAARAEAQRSGKLVAVCFPSDGKTNSFSQDALVRKGEQRGHVFKILSYGNEYKGYIFAGQWPGATRETHDILLGWDTATSDEMVLFFRPDGTAFSNDIPSLDGNYPLVVGSEFVSSSGGPTGTLSAVTNPATVWISRAGTVTVDEKSVPAGTLPSGGSVPSVAALSLDRVASPIAPRIRDIEYLPKEIPGEDTVGLGQNYVNVHPEQKESERLEYGIATLLVKATDTDGGPLFYELEAFSSDAEVGAFSISKDEGAMSYVYDAEDRQYYWQALISWRPPPGAEEGTEYELSVTVKDEQGLSDNARSGAGLLPKFGTLSPVRMVMAASDGHLYLANMAGRSTIELTEPGQPEREPFFSQDGSRIYSFRDMPGGGQQLRVRNADGSRVYRVLRDFSGSVMSTLQYDPTYTYVAYLDPTPPAPTIFPYQYPWRRNNRGAWTLRDGSSSYSGQRIEVLHLRADEPPLTITTLGRGPFNWVSSHKHALAYDTVSVPGRVSNYGLGPYIPSPGYENSRSGTQLVGFPPTLNSIDPTTTTSAAGQVYNPADENWYLIHDGSSLRLRSLTGGRDEIVHSGPIHGKPSWSSNGEQVAFVASTGSGRRVEVKRVLTDSFTLSTPFETRFEYTGGNLSNAQLDPDAAWVFFLDDGHLYRALNSSGAARADLSEDLGKNIADYVVAP